MPDGPGVPDILVDQIGIMTTEWGVILMLNTLLPQNAVETLPSDEIQTNIHMPVELRGLARLTYAHAKITTILLKRILKRYEENSGEIQIPQSAVDRHHILPADWE